MAGGEGFRVAQHTAHDPMRRVVSGRYGRARLHASHYNVVMKLVFCLNFPFFFVVKDTNTKIHKGDFVVGSIHAPPLPTRARCDCDD